MMSVTRRTFLQYSLAAGLTAAADATRSHWLLSRDRPMRIGVAGLGPFSEELLAIFAAIPGAQVIGITDSESKRIDLACRTLEELGQNRPCVYRDVSSMLTDTNLEAISISPHEPSMIFNLNKILKAKVPVLADCPPPLELPRDQPLFDAVMAARRVIEFRLGDFIYPASIADLPNWLNRSKPAPLEARLVVSPTSTKRDLRLAAIFALDALFAASTLTAEELRLWMDSTEAKIDIVNGGTLVIFALPRNPSGVTSLRVDLLGSVGQKTTLLVHHRSGRIEIAVSDRPDADSSLRTAMKFLNLARHGHGYDSFSAGRAQTAAVFVDRFIGQIAR